MSTPHDPVHGSSPTPPAEGWITTPLTEELLRGALELERTAQGVQPHRLPARARAQAADRKSVV